LDRTPGFVGSAAAATCRKGSDSVVGAFWTTGAASGPSAHTIDVLQDAVRPGLQSRLGSGVRLTVGGTAAEVHDFSDAVYSKFPYALVFVIVLTFVLLMRAFRSVFLPLKAVVLNLVSLVAAYGIIG